jgi:hypothetical protein
MKLDIRILVEMTEKVLFSARPYFGHVWLLSIQQEDWKRTPHNKRDDRQREWFEQKVQHARGNIRLFLRIVVGIRASDAFTGIKRLHATIVEERNQGKNGRRARSSTFHELLTTFMGGTAELERLVERVPGSDASLWHSVVVPTLLTPEAGVRAEDLPTVFSDLMSLLAVLFHKTSSKNGAIRRVKTHVRRHWDESKAEVGAALRYYPNVVD